MIRIVSSTDASRRSCSTAVGPPIDDARGGVADLLAQPGDDVERSRRVGLVLEGGLRAARPPAPSRPAAASPRRRRRRPRAARDRRLDLRRRRARRCRSAPTAPDGNASAISSCAAIDSTSSRNELPCVRPVEKFSSPSDMTTSAATPSRPTRRGRARTRSPTRRQTRGSRRPRGTRAHPCSNAEEPAIEPATHDREERRQAEHDREDRHACAGRPSARAGRPGARCRGGHEDRPERADAGASIGVWSAASGPRADGTNGQNGRRPTIVSTAGRNVSIESSATRTASAPVGPRPAVPLTFASVSDEQRDRDRQARRDDRRTGARAARAPSPRACPGAGAAPPDIGRRAAARSPCRRR